MNTRHRSIRYPTLLLIGLTVLAALSRLLPHPPNVSPIAALALLGGATLSFPWSFVLPTTAMLLSDLILGFDRFPITLSVYGSFCATVALGRWIKGHQGPWSLLGASLGSSVIFYLITNAAVWWFSGMYQRTGSGLILSYVFALPFFRHTLLGDLAYTFTLFLSVWHLPQVFFITRWRAQPSVRSQHTPVLPASAHDVP